MRSRKPRPSGSEQDYDSTPAEGLQPRCLILLLAPPPPDLFPTPFLTVQDLRTSSHPFLFLSFFLLGYLSTSIVEKFFTIYFYTYIYIYMYACMYIYMYTCTCVNICFARFMYRLRPNWPNDDRKKVLFCIKVKISFFLIISSIFLTLFHSAKI